MDTLEDLTEGLFTVNGHDRLMLEDGTCAFFRGETGEHWIVDVMYTDQPKGKNIHVPKRLVDSTPGQILRVDLSLDN